MGDPGGALSLAEESLDAADASSTAPVLLRRAMAYAAHALPEGPGARELFDDAGRRAGSAGCRRSRPRRT